LWLLARQVAIVMSCALVLALTANVVSPCRIAWSEDWASRVETKAAEEGIGIVAMDQVAKIVQTKARIIFDARSKADFATGHLPGAISLPSEGIDDVFPEVQLLLRPNTPILVYCSGKQCDESLLLARFLKQQGYANIAMFVEGFGAWQEAGSAVERGS